MYNITLEVPIPNSPLPIFQSGRSPRARTRLKEWYFLDSCPCGTLKVPRSCISFMSSMGKMTTTRAYRHAGGYGGVQGGNRHYVVYILSCRGFLSGLNSETIFGHGTYWRDVWMYMLCDLPLPTGHRLMYTCIGVFFFQGKLVNQEIWVVFFIDMCQCSNRFGHINLKGTVDHN